MFETYPHTLSNNKKKKNETNLRSLYPTSYGSTDLDWLPLDLERQWSTSVPGRDSITSCMRLAGSVQERLVGIVSVWEVGQPSRHHVKMSGTKRVTKRLADSALCTKMTWFYLFLVCRPFAVLPLGTYPLRIRMYFGIYTEYCLHVGLFIRSTDYTFYLWRVGQPSTEPHSELGS